METAFKAIGFDVSTENAYAALAADVGARGEISVLDRADGVLYARCLKLGSGLEVWMQFYESSAGVVVYTNYRPGFRARRVMKIAPWILTESDRDGTSMIHGFIDDTNAEVLFQLQNRTEISPLLFEGESLHVGLCGLAYRAEISQKELPASWLSYDETTTDIDAEENIWGITGRIAKLEQLRNKHSAADLYWLLVETKEFELEVIVNGNVLSGVPRIGASIVAEVWLQGHVVVAGRLRGRYEGVDLSVNTVDHWQRFRRLN